MWLAYHAEVAMHHGMALRESGTKRIIWIWVRIKPPGIGLQVLVLVSIYQGSIWGTYFDPRPFPPHKTGPGAPEPNQFDARSIGGPPLSCSCLV